MRDSGTYLAFVTHSQHVRNYSQWAVCFVVDIQTCDLNVSVKIIDICYLLRNLRHIHVILLAIEYTDLPDTVNLEIFGRILYS